MQSVMYFITLGMLAVCFCNKLQFIKTTITASFNTCVHMVNNFMKDLFCCMLLFPNISPKKLFINRMHIIQIDVLL